MAWHKSLSAAGLIQALKEKLARLQRQWRSTRRENERLRQENEELRRREKQLEREQEQLRHEQERLQEERERLRRERERLRQENERLKRQLEEAQRANKRQAAPFSRHRQKQNPKPPGRKSGAGYGQRYRKAIPEQVDEVIAVPLPAHCQCGGRLELEGSNRNTSTRWCAKRSGGALILPSVAAVPAISECKGGIRARPRMRWEPQPRNWGQRRWPWESR